MMLRIAAALFLVAYLGLCAAFVLALAAGTPS